MLCNLNKYPLFYLSCVEGHDMQSMRGCVLVFIIFLFVVCRPLILSEALGVDRQQRRNDAKRVR